MRKKIAFLLAGAAIATGSLAACSNAGGDQTQQGAPVAPQVPVAEVIVREVAPSAEFNGALAEPQSVELRPRVSGQIISVSMPEGGMVRRGQTLFRIDPRPFQVVLDQAQAQLRQAEAQAAKAQADFERAESLVATGAIARKQYDDAATQRRAAQAGVQAGRAAVAAARLDLSFTHVTSPIAGRVDRILVTEGNMVAGGAGSAPLTTIMSVDPLYVEFDIDEATYLNFVEQARKGGSAAKLPVAVGLMTDQGYPHHATLDFLGNGIDRSAGTIRARAIIRNSGGDLAPGLFARVKLSLGAAQPAILIDDQAVGSDQGRNYVLVVGKDKKAEYRPIVLGPVIDGLRVVKSGLNPGDTIIIKGLVRPGMQVTPRKGPMVQPASAAVATPPAGRPANAAKTKPATAAPQAEAASKEAR